MVATRRLSTPSSSLSAPRCPQWKTRASGRRVSSDTRWEGGSRCTLRPSTPTRFGAWCSSLRHRDSRARPSVACARSPTMNSRVRSSSTVSRRSSIVGNACRFSSHRAARMRSCGLACVRSARELGGGARGRAARLGHWRASFAVGRSARHPRADAAPRRRARPQVRVDRRAHGRGAP